MALISLNLPTPEKRSGMFGDPTTPMTAVAVWNDLDGGPTASGEVISERTALAVSTVYTCVTTLAEAIASLPCRLMRRLGKGREEATDHYLYNLLAYEPCEDMSAFTFWSTMVGCAALTGNGYAEITRDPDDTPNGFWPLNPLKTAPVRLPDGTLAFKTHDGQKDLNKSRIIPAKNVLHFPLFSMDGIKGVSPVAAARESFALSKAAEKFGARWFGNGAHASCILINKSGQKPDPKVQAELRDSWQSAYGGSNANKQPFLWGEWSVETVGVSPEDSQFLATRNFQRADIAAMYKLQPHQAGDTSRLSNSNHTQAQLSFVTDCLRPIITRMEAELKRKVLGIKSNLFVNFDLSERLRGDFTATMTGINVGRQSGVLTANEGRELLGLNPVGPEGDVLMYPVNFADADQLLKDDTLIPTTQEPAEPEPTVIPPAPKKKAKK